MNTRKIPQKSPHLTRTMCLMACISFLSGCGKQTQGIQQEQSAMPQNMETKEEATVSDITVNQDIRLPFKAPLKFIFASGAGAWGTSLTLSPDGSFTGGFDDSEMTDQGEGYPHGSHYTCSFSGQFHDIRQVNGHTYSMAIDGITLQDPLGKEWIEEEIRYVASEPRGLECGKEFLLFTPDTPIEELSEEFLNWWPGYWLYQMPDSDTAETLSCYGLYNQEPGYGFFANYSLE